MKYFIDEIEESFLTKNDNQWSKNCKRYWEQFEQIADEFPPLFVQVYRKTAFHDFDIISTNWYLDINRRKPVFLIQIQMQYDDNIYTVKYYNISNMTINFEKASMGQSNNYRYGEILPVNDNRFSHEIAFGENSSIYFEFRKLTFNIRKLRT